MSKARELADVIGTQDTTENVLQGRKNLIINGAMQVAQRGTSATNVGGNVYSTVDRWVSEHGGVTLDQEQSTDVPSGSGFSYSRKATCQTTASLAAGEYIIPFEQRFEGNNLQQLAYGTSSAKTMTLSFWIKSSKTGTGTVEFRNNGGSKINVTQFTISAANTWEHKTIVISGDTANNFTNSTGSSATMFFWLVAGSNYNSGSVVSGWQTPSPANRAVGVSSSVSSGDYWSITGVQLEVGSVATPFEHRSYGEELALCQRYFERKLYNANGYITTMANWNDVSHYGGIGFEVTKRANPSMSTSAVANFRLYGSGVYVNPTSINFNAASVNNVEMYANTTSKTPSANWLRTNATGSYIDIDAEL